MGRYLAVVLISAVVWLTSCAGSKTAATSSNNNQNGSDKKTTKKEIGKKAGKVIETARTFKGTPYKFGGLDKKGLDCSGLVYRSFESVEVKMPRTSKEQSELGKPLKIGDLKPGDLVFFGEKKGSKKVVHVGIVTDSNYPDKIKFIHASTQKGVIEEEMLSPWYKSVFIKGVRMF